ncbi:MAG: 4a-hydroxytetrahydrobiopterin dehydratase [Micromonosporaceae bacterium]
MAELLDDVAVATALRDLDGWTGDATGITRTVEMASFPAVIAAVVEIAKVAEDMDHHPDIDIRWRTLTLRCATHSAGGVTDRDIALANRVDQIIAAA